MSMESEQMLAAARIMSAAASSYARTQGMIAENQHRISVGQSVAYGADEFYGEAKYLEDLTQNLNVI